MSIAKMNNEYNQRMQGQQNAYNLDMWNKQNDYNSPASQLSRLKDAGLNPNLIYGNGSASTGNSGNIQTESPKAAQQVSVAPVNYFKGLSDGLQNAVSTMLQYKSLESRIDRNDALNAVSGTQADLNRVTSDLRAAQILSEKLRPEMIAEQMNFIHERTAKAFYETANERNRSFYSDTYYRQQIDSQAVAIKLSSAQIDRISFEMSTILPLRAEQISAMIESLKRGTDLRELEASLKRTDVDWKTADKIINTIATVLGGIAKFK